MSLLRRGYGCLQIMNAYIDLIVCSFVLQNNVRLCMQLQMSTGYDILIMFC